MTVSKYLWILAIGMTFAGSGLSSPARAAAACFASDADSKGANALEQGFRTVVRKTLERQAAPGMDGAVTVSFQSFKVSPPRRWMTSDGFNFSSDQTKPVYSLRVAFTTCTDFRTQILLRKQERNFECFTAPTGEAACQTSGNTGGLAQDTSQYIAK